MDYNTLRVNTGADSEVSKVSSGHSLLKKNVLKALPDVPFSLPVKELKGVEKFGNLLKHAIFASSQSIHY